MRDEPEPGVAQPPSPVDLRVADAGDDGVGDMAAPRDAAAAAAAAACRAQGGDDGAAARMAGARDAGDAAAEAEQWLRERRAFVVLGAMKCGTTALREHLLVSSTWDEGVSLPWQELHFFDDDAEFERGPAHYASWFRWGDEWEPPVVLGDITPSYLYIPQVVPRLRRLLPNALLVVMLRNPLDRAVSHQNHDLAKGREVPVLSERIAQERAEARAESRRDIFGRGLYASQLDRVLAHFPRDRLLVVVSERYRRDPVAGLRDVRSFLGLPAATLCSHKFRREVFVRGKYAETLAPEERARLRDLYAEDVARLRVLLGDPLLEWAADFALPEAQPERPRAADGDGGVDDSDEDLRRTAPVARQRIAS